MLPRLWRCRLPEQSDAIRPLRGNVPTRIARLRDGDFDAILLADAGVERLGCDLSGLVVRHLSTRELLPAPGQGALAVETRVDDGRVREIVNSVHDATAAETTGCERLLLRRLEGGCHLPLGAYACRTHEGSLTLEAALGELNGSTTRASVRRVVVDASSVDDVVEAAYAGLRVGP